MKTIELNLREVLELQIELEGFTNPQTGESIIKGFVNHPLSLKEKYWLNKLTGVLSKEKAEIEKLRNQLIEKFGEKEENDSIVIPMTITDKDNNEMPNPKLIQFQEEYQELLNETKTITYNPISIKTLENIITEDNYNLLFRLVASNEEILGEEQPSAS